MRGGFLAWEDLEPRLRLRAQAAVGLLHVGSLDVAIPTAEGGTTLLGELVAAPAGPDLLAEDDLRALLRQLHRHDPDAFALLELVAEGWHPKWLAQLLGCSRQELEGQIEAARAELRQAVPGVVAWL